MRYLGERVHAFADELTKIAYYGRDPLYGGGASYHHDYDDPYAAAEYGAQANTRERALGRMTPEEHKQHRAVNSRGAVRGLIGAGIGAVGGGLLAAALGRAGSRLSSGLTGALGGAALGGGIGHVYHEGVEGGQHRQNLRQIAYGDREKEKKADLANRIGKGMQPYVDKQRAMRGLVPAQPMPGSSQGLKIP